MTILQIDSSITGDHSVSRQLTKATTRQLLAVQPATALVERDLVAQPLAHFTLGGSGDEEVLDEFLAAETVVIGAPMYNFGVPSQLKAWIDRISIAGKTFRYTAEGRPEGLVGDKRVIVAISRGSFYEEGGVMEHVETYLKGVFGFLGITPEFVHADGIAVGPEQREAGIAKGLGEVERLAA
ncbi:MAG: NAD(P)H-dependent oxidoreductase [Pseudomonadota bacterium]|nr:NAD(P)H-dependent oxidoreductase [Pseudomonadota bacterium]